MALQDQNVILGSLIAIMAAKFCALTLSFGYLSQDDMNFILSSQLNEDLRKNLRVDGRYFGLIVSYFLDILNINLLQSFHLVAVIYAASFAFFWIAFVRYLRANIGSGVIIGAGLITILHPAVLDLDQYKVQFLPYSFMYIFSGLALLSLASQAPKQSTSFLVIACTALAFLSYQPSLLLLSLAILLRVVTNAMHGDTKFGRADLIRSLKHAGLLALGLVVSLVLTAVGVAITGIQITRLSPLISLAELPARLWNYLHAVGAIMSPVSKMYSSMSGSLPFLILLLLSLFIVVLRRKGIFRIAGLTALVGIVILSQNPMTTSASFYWPTLRSNFHITFAAAGLLLATIDAWPPKARSWIVASIIAAALFNSAIFYG